MRRIGVLLPGNENNPLGKTFFSALTQALAGLGWTDGRNVQMDARWAGTDINRIRALAHELVALQPDIVVAGGTLTIAALQRETRTIQIVFAGVGDPVASGLVARLDRPSGNITGFANFEDTLAGKWLELLSEIAPGLKRVAIMFNPDTAVSAYMPSFEMAARSLKVVPRGQGRDGTGAPRPRVQSNRLEGKQALLSRQPHPRVMARAEITQGSRRGILRVDHHPEGGRCLGCRGNSTAEGRGAGCGCTGYNPPSRRTHQRCRRRCPRAILRMW